jgi:hypothetical protein
LLFAEEVECLGQTVVERKIPVSAVVVSLSALSNVGKAQIRVRL